MPLRSLEDFRLDHLVPGADLADDVEAVRDVAEDGVHAVEVGAVLGVEDDEELRTASVLPGVRHAEEAEAVAARVALRLALDGVPGAAGAGAAVALRLGVGAAALHDEVREDAVEVDAVVEALLDKRQEVLHGLGGVLLEQLDLDGAPVRGHADDREAAFLLAHGGGDGIPHLS